jgi:phage host-nuclease inhibitor protein Gam
MIAVVASLLLAQAHPCLADAQKLCKEVQPGEGRIAACLKQHESELSAECKQKQASFRDQVEELTEACKDDVQKFCANVEPGAGRIARCLQQNADHLSPQCKAKGEKMLAQRKQRRGEMHDVAQACKPDAERFCADVQPGAGRIAQCLKQHQSELSEPCTHAVRAAQRQ